MLRRIEAATISLTSIAVDGLINLNSNGRLYECWASHGHDVVIPFSTYLFISAVERSYSTRNKSIITFSLPAMAEILQGFNLYPGTFDWYDFIAFGIGVGLAAITERFIYRKSFQKTIEPENNPVI